ncbi:hypothetical protein MMC24_006076 [Lignoscripta atroalba]|nr:hypothetical protein [Lignoscripta atroalba]
MTSLQITDDDIPSLGGKVAIVTGASSGIGLAAAEILASKGAKVYMLDLNAPEENVPAGAEYIRCNVTSWADLRAIFGRIGHLDIAIANAGISEETDYFMDTFDNANDLIEPKYAVLDVNYRAVLNFVKLSISHFRRQGKGGSIVITSSATAYSPEQSLPVYSATKLAVSAAAQSILSTEGEAEADSDVKLIGLVRSLRPILTVDNITINAVAPAATITKLLPKDLARPIMDAGLPVSSAHHVGLAIVYSVVAEQAELVEPYGKDSDVPTRGRWNGRTILTIGDSYTELEGPIAKLRPQWFGEKNTTLTRMQQKVTDIRG